MPFNPSGTVYLIGAVPLDNTYEHTIDFADSNEQFNYFSGKAVQVLDDYTYTRKQSIIVEFNLESIRNVNYIMFRNYSNSKLIFAFITDKVYIGESATELFFETDVFQTYLFDHTWRESFIEREHQDRWSGANSPIFNVLDEGLTLGDEYLKESDQQVAVNDKCFLVMTSEQIDADSPVAPFMIQGFPTPFYYYLFPWSGVGVGDVLWLCNMIALEPRILSCTYIPYLPFDIMTNAYPVDYVYNGGASTQTILRVMADCPNWAVLNTLNAFSGLTLPGAFGTGITADPIKYESKLLTHPYSYSLLTDFRTKPLVLKHEYLSSPSSVEIAVSQGLDHNPKTKYYISNGYLGETNGKLHCIIDNSVNDLPLKSSEYYNYMLTHKSQITSGLAVLGAEAVGTMAVGALTGGIGAGLAMSTLMGTASQVAGQMSKQKDLKNVPDTVRQMGNNIAFDLADGNTVLKLLRYGVAPQIKALLGEYFTRYGYKSMRLKIPSLRSRYYFNYIKTIGANIDGDFDNRDLAKLKEIYNNGITIWHNRAGVTPLSYQYDNVEMSLL